MEKTGVFSYFKLSSITSALSKGLDWWGKHQRYWWIGVIIVTAAWLSYDVGRIVARADLVKMGGASRGSIGIPAAANKATELNGGRLLITSSKTARFVDGNGLAWDIPDFGDKVSRNDIDNLKSSGVTFDGSVNIDLIPVKTSAKDILATTFLDVLFRLGLVGMYAFIFYLLLKYLNNSKKGRFRSIGVSDKPDVHISDVAGHENAKGEVLEIVEFLKDSKRFKDLGANPPRGVLMYGPPGNGKTLLAKAIAGEAKAHFLEQSASSFIQIYAGEGAKAIRTLFDEARKNLPCVIFIDEIDAIGESRKSGMQSQESRQTLLALLTEMDGFDGSEGIVVIAATNQEKILDEALTRAGRFDRKVYIPLPNLHDRLEILKVHAAKLPRMTANLEFWAAQTPGFSGASLANLVNEAAIEAARSHKSSVTDDDFSLAKDRVLMGTKDSTRKISEKEKRIVSYHEIGHALLRIKVGGRVEKVSIEPRGYAMGVTISAIEEEQINLYTEEEIRSEILVMMGGRAAEQVFCKTITTGSYDDMEKASELARKAITLYGFGQDSPYITKSPQLLQELETKASKWISDEYKRAIQIIEDNKEKVEAAAVLLLEKSELNANDLKVLE